MGNFPKNGKPRPLRQQEEVRRYELGELVPRSLRADGLATSTYPIVDPDDETLVLGGGLMLAFYQTTDLIGVPIRLEMDDSGFGRIEKMLVSSIGGIRQRLRVVDEVADGATPAGSCERCGTRIFGGLVAVGLCGPCQR